MMSWVVGVPLGVALGLGLNWIGSKRGWFR